MQMLSPAAASPTALTGVARGSDMVPALASFPPADTYSVLATSPVPGAAPARSEAAAPAHIINTTPSPGIITGRIKASPSPFKDFLPHSALTCSISAGTSRRHGYPWRPGTV